MNDNAKQFTNYGTMVEQGKAPRVRRINLKRCRAEIFYRFINGETQRSLSDCFDVCPRSIGKAIKSYLMEEGSMEDFFLYKNYSGKSGANKFRDLDDIEKAIKAREKDRNHNESKESEKCNHDVIEYHDDKEISKDEDHTKKEEVVCEKNAQEVKIKFLFSDLEIDIKVKPKD